MDKPSKEVLVTPYDLREMHRLRRDHKMHGGHDARMRLTKVTNLYFDDLLVLADEALQLRALKGTTHGK